MTLINVNVFRAFYAWVLVAICILINQILYFLFGLGTPTFHILVPINEELIRLFSIMLGPVSSWLYTSTIVIEEFVIYSAKISKEVGFIPTSFIILRIICALMHFLFMGIQTFAWHYSKICNKKIYIFIGYFFAVTLHYTWNTKVSILIGYFMTH